MPDPTRFSTRSRLVAPVATAAGWLATRASSMAQEASPMASPAATSDWLTIGGEMWDLMRQHFDAGDHLFTERSPRNTDDRTYSYLWPYAAVLSGITNLANESPDFETARDDAFIALERYFDPEIEPVGYDSYVVDDGGGDKFYDDNEWLGIDFVHAYRQTGDNTYLDRAIVTWEFALSGWTDTLGGGIHWKQYDMSTKNTCSNGPAAVLAMMLYERTEDPQYLDWAVRIMEWVKQLRDPVTGVYWDNIHVEGSINETTWTYNTGTPMHASALLYTATGEQAWLDDARSLAEASLAHFAPAETIDGQEVHVFPDHAWFNSILFRGYEALYEADPEPDPTFLEAALGWARFGWEHARDDRGLLYRDWTGRTPVDEPRELIQQAPILEIAAIGHRFEMGSS
jgi:hypothetical protein